jgi:glycine/D-amino acid oxidase-like deaminating enzyme
MKTRRIKMVYDKIIIGAGLYGLYSALYCGKRGEKVLVLEYDKEPFKRATYINQARVHMGYHYPRSFSTAIKSAGYFEDLWRTMLSVC